MFNDETALIEAAKRGDPESFGVIVSRYMPKALGFARQMTGNADEAQDLAQEAFVKAYRSLDTFRGESEFRTWFYRVLSNVCLDHLRKASFLKKVFFLASPRDAHDDGDAIVRLKDSSPESRPDRGLRQQELNRMLNRAIMGLPRRQRAVFLMKHHEGMKLREIATVLGISEGAVKSHLIRAVAALRTRMEDYEKHG